MTTPRYACRTTPSHTYLLDKGCGFRKAPKCERAMEFPQSVQSAFLERKAEASEGLIRLVAWPVINEQLVYLLDLQPVTQATPLPVDATASGEGQSAALPVDLMSILKGKSLSRILTCVCVCCKTVVYYSGSRAGC